MKKKLIMLLQRIGLYYILKIINEFIQKKMNLNLYTVIKVKQNYDNKKTSNFFSPHESCKEKNKIALYSPITGVVKSLNDIDDDKFSNNTFGKGIAIEPTKSKVVGPINGIITSIASSRQAIEIKADSGLQLLIHIGIDTEELEGKYYTYYVKVGDKIEVGSLLIEFDRIGICLDGYPVTTSIIILNPENYKSIIPIAHGEIKEKELLLDIERL